MRASFAVIPLALVASACQRAGEPANNASAVDINAAAEQAQGDIDTYGSNALQTPSEAATNPPLPRPTASAAPAQLTAPAPPPLTPPAPGEPGGLPDDRTPVSEAPFTSDSAQGAANVVQTYYALIEGGDYRKAWLIWGDGGTASGMSADAFAASFARYADYHANVGAPGRVDAGAGQRYVTVPVQVYGRLKADGRLFNMRGDITLHRTADIDGATAEQKRWHISTANIKPRAVQTPPSAAPLIDSGPAAGVPASNGSVPSD